MSRVLSLALKITGDASGVRLTPVERALKRLGEETDKVGKVFDKFAKDSDAGQRAQAQFANESQRLTEALKSGAINGREFAEQFAKVAESANKEAAALERAAQLTAKFEPEAAKFARTQAELNEQVSKGRITQEVYNAAIESAAKGLTDAERAAAGLAARTADINSASQSSALKFNELSGVLAILPGPLGNIAGRISGIASASEGLSRIFAGGLRSGITNLVGSFTALVNPVTAALAGITALAAGSTAVARGLIQLEDRVENLGNIANKLGVSFEFIQTLEEGARRSGTSIDAVSAAFGRLQKSVLGVDEESKAAQKALAEIGLTAQELQSLAPEEQYERIGQAIASIEDPAKRTATATALFGRAGADLIPFFNNIGQAAADIERYGRALSELDRGRIDAFGASLDALAVAGQGLGQSLLLPFTGLGDGISRALAEVTAGITSIIDPIGRVLEPALTNIGRVVEGLGVALGTIGRIIGAVFEPFAVVVQAVAQAFEPLYESFLEFQRALSDSIVSVTEWVVSFTPIGAIAANAQAFGETISRVITIITTAFSRVGEFIGNLVSQFAEFFGLSDAITAIGNTISSIFGGVSEVFSTIANAIGGVVGRLLTIAENFLGIDRSAQAAAEATATLGTEIEALTEEERKLATEREKFLQGFSDSVSKAIDESAQFGQAGFDAALQYQEAIDELQRQFDAGILNETAFARAAEQANEAYRQQVQIIKDSAAEAERKAKAEQDAADKIIAATQSVIDKTLERIRIDQQFDGDSARAKNSEDLSRVRDEIGKVFGEIANATRTFDREGARRAQARLETLQKVEAKLVDIDKQFADRADEIAQGFAEGFDKAFADSARGLDPLIEKASRFGNEGARAAQELQRGIDDLQRKVRDGVLGKAAYDADLAAQRQLFAERIQQLDEIAQREQQQREAAFNAQVAANNRLQEVLNAQVPERIAAAAGIAALERQKLAAENLAAIENQIDLTRRGLEAAREQGNRNAAAARVNELKFLEDLAKAERAIIDGKAADRQDQRKLLDEQAKASQELFKQEQSRQQQLRQQQQRAQEERARAAAEEAERQEKRIRALNSIGQQSIGGADIRTQQGASQFISAAAGAIDPELAQQRAQTKLLQKIATNSGALQFLERGIGQSVAILRGGA
jgi:phage-related protein